VTTTQSEKEEEREKNKKIGKYPPKRPSLGLQRSISFRRTLLRCQQTDFNLQNTVQAQMTLPIHHYNVIPASTTINTLPSFSSRFRHGRHA
jgi:hypothetical protein